MSRPDKTLISIQIGKITEEQVRWQYEKHLRTSPSAHNGIQKHLNPVRSIRPVGHGAGGKPGCSGLGGRVTRWGAVLGVLPTSIVCYFTRVLLDINTPAPKGD